MWQGAAPGVLQASFGGDTLNLTASGFDEEERRMDIRREPGPRRLRPCFHAQRLSIIVPSMEHQKHHRLFHHQTFRGRRSSRSCQAPRRGARSAAAGRTAAPTKSPLFRSQDFEPGGSGESSLQSKRNRPAGIKSRTRPACPLCANPTNNHSFTSELDPPANYVQKPKKQLQSMNTITKHA